MTLPPLYLLRHGQTNWNRDRRLQGQMESDLTDLGRGQATRQGEILAALGLPARVSVLCSPLRRTRQTADLALALPGLTPVFDDRLKEIHLGHWEGRMIDDLKQDHPEAFHGRAVFDVYVDGPGEGFDEMQARLSAFAADLTGPSVVISHGIALSFLRGLALGLDRAGMARLGHEQGIVTEIRSGIEVIHR